MHIPQHTDPNETRDTALFLGLLLGLGLSVGLFAISVLLVLDKTDEFMVYTSLMTGFWVFLFSALIAGVLSSGRGGAPR